MTTEVVADGPPSASWPQRDGPSAGSGPRSEGSETHRRGPERPDLMLGHGVVLATYATSFAAAVSLAERSGPDRRNSPQIWSDLALVGLATYKISRALTKQTVTTPLRAPFTRDVGPAGAGERNARARGSGLRHTVGELLSCPFCLDVWVASGGTLGLRLAPRAFRPILTTFAAVAVADLLQFVHVSWQHDAEQG